MSLDFQQRAAGEASESVCYENMVAVLTEARLRLDLISSSVLMLESCEGLVANSTAIKIQPASDVGEHRRLGEYHDLKELVSEIRRLLSSNGKSLFVTKGEGGVYGLMIRAKAGMEEQLNLSFI
ncbi:MAG: hypothetical protein ABII07_02610 [Patescibacteria group bacterium]|nr:hypothetical protein [Patescibacteria group bacterium]